MTRLLHFGIYCKGLKKGGDGVKVEETQIDIEAILHRHVYYGSKRIFDFILTLLGLVLLIPVFIIIPILIKMDDGGPIFYRATRIGKNGKPFRMLKFRSMRVNADQEIQKLKEQNEVSGAMFKMKNDPRITRIGKLLRQTSLDELPQFFNVLLGDMSLVGPRPPLPDEVVKYTERDKLRLLVTPGLTGLWQVTARNSVGFEEMVNLDLQYIEKSNIWLDLKIILMTVKVVIVPNDAY